MALIVNKSEKEICFLKWLFCSKGHVLGSYFILWLVSLNPNSSLLNAI